MVDIRESEPLQALRNYANPSAMKRRINDFDVRMMRTRLRTEGERENVMKIRLIHFFTHQLNLAAMLSPLKLPQRRVVHL